MTTRINYNAGSVRANRALQNNTGGFNKSLERLSTGLRINRAADDAAGLVISEQLRAQSNGLEQAYRNAQDAWGVVQTGEGALGEVANILQRMRTLAVQAGNEGTLDTDAYDAINDEMIELGEEVNRINDSTRFTDLQLFDGAFTGTFQIGPSDSTAVPGDVITINMPDIGTDNLEANFDADVIGGAITDNATANAALISIDNAIENVSGFRSELGSAQNRLESTMQSLQIANENVSAIESRIRDTDMASEMVEFTRVNILRQASTSMLAQANSSPQSILQLLGYAPARGRPAGQPPRRPRLPAGGGGRPRPVNVGCAVRDAPQCPAGRTVTVGTPSPPVPPPTSVNESLTHRHANRHRPDRRGDPDDTRRRGPPRPRPDRPAARPARRPARHRRRGPPAADRHRRHAAGPHR